MAKTMKRNRMKRRKHYFLGVEMNPQLWIALVQYMIVGTCLWIAILTGRFVDWLITISWAMTATLWLCQGLEVQGRGSDSKSLRKRKGTRRAR